MRPSPSRSPRHTIQPTLFDIRPIQSRTVVPTVSSAPPVSSAPSSSPPHNGTSTSRAAAEAIKPVAATIAERVFEFVRDRTWSGATREEISVMLGLPIQTVCARVSELLEAGQLAESTRVRPTKSHRSAKVLIAAR